MSNEKEKKDLGNQLQLIKDSLEKKLSEAETPLKKNDNSKENMSKKKKPIPINVGMEVVSNDEKENNTSKKNHKTEKPISVKVGVELSSNNKEENKVSKNVLKTEKPVNKLEIYTEKSTTSPKPKVNREKRKKKKKFPVFPIIFLVILLGSLGYVYSLKKKLKAEENQFEKDKAESIDYREDVYFKEVEDEVDDEEMQDFAVYKDVPEVVAEKNSNSKVLSASDEKIINQQISKKEADRKSNLANTSSSSFVKEASTSKPQSNKKNTSNTTETASTQSKTTSITEIKKDEVYSDLIQVIGLEHKNGNFTLPKKVKKTNAFKVRIRLKKNQIKFSDKDNEIMLVIKDNNGKTIKIDSKKVNFKRQNSKVLNLEFYEIFPERLKTNNSYSFSVFTDRKLIKSYRKSI